MQQPPRTWSSTTPRELIAALRISGWVVGHSGLWPRYFTLHKTDLIRDLQSLPPEHACLWRIKGDPKITARYASDRRTVVIWLGSGPTHGNYLRGD